MAEFAYDKVSDVYTQMKGINGEIKTLLTEINTEVSDNVDKVDKALFGDLGPTGITKKTAIEALLKHLGADAKDTISFGDAKIDLSMFELCAYNVAMGNGGPEIKEAADYITTDVDEDGLWNAFKYLELI